MSSINPANPATPLPSEDLVHQLAMLGIPEGSYDFQPLNGLRKLIARRMLDSVRIAPHFSASIRIETDALMACRSELNRGAATKISVNDLLIKAAALALVDCPRVNSSYTDAGIITHRHADVAFAVSMEGGLVTPIVHGAEAKSVSAIAEETRDLADRGRRKRLRPEEYNGGSFTVSNLGMYGVSSFDAIINQPQSAIVSVGAPERGFVIDGDMPRIASLMIATLTSDHRLIDGATAASWLQAFKRAIEAPTTWATSG